MDGGDGVSEYRISATTLSEVGEWLTKGHEIGAEPRAPGVLLVPGDMLEAATADELAIFVNLCRVYGRTYEEAVGIDGPVAYDGPID